MKLSETPTPTIGDTTGFARLGFFVPPESTVNLPFFPPSFIVRAFARSIVDVVVEFECDLVGGEVFGLGLVYALVRVLVVLDPDVELATFDIDVDVDVEVNGAVLRFVFVGVTETVVAFVVGLGAIGLGNIGLITLLFPVTLSFPLAPLLLALAAEVTDEAEGDCALVAVDVAGDGAGERPEEDVDVDVLGIVKKRIDTAEREMRAEAEAEGEEGGGLGLWRWLDSEWGKWDGERPAVTDAGNEGTIGVGQGMEKAERRVGRVRGR